MERDIFVINCPDENMKDRIKDLNKFRLSGLFCDLRIIVKNNEYRAHKSVIATASDFLFNQLKEKEGSQQRGVHPMTTITLDQLNSAGFKPLLEYIYTGVLSITLGNIFDVLAASSYLQMFEVSRKIQQHCSQVYQQNSFTQMLSRIFNQALVPPHLMPGIPPAFNMQHQLPHHIPPPPNADALAAASMLGGFPQPQSNGKLATIQNTLHLQQEKLGQLYTGHGQPKLDMAGNLDQIDPVMLERMRQYAGVKPLQTDYKQKGSRKHNFEQSQACHQHTSTPKKLSVSTELDKKVKTDHKAGAVDSQKARPSSADDINSKKHKLCNTSAKSETSSVSSGELESVKVKRNKSCDDRVHQTPPSNEPNTNNCNNKVDLENSSEGARQERLKSSDYKQQNEQNRNSPAKLDEDTKEAPIDLANGKTCVPPMTSLDHRIPSNQHLVQMLRKGKGEASKADKATVDEFANKLLGNPGGIPFDQFDAARYKNLLEKINGENLRQYLHGNRMAPRQQWLGQRGKMFPIKPHCHGDGSTRSSAMNHHAGNMTSQREVDLPKLPSTGRYSTVRRRTLQSNKPKPYQCKICNSTFTRYHNLKQHVKLHSGVKPFECDICHKKFTRNYTLKLHKAKHYSKSGGHSALSSSFENEASYDSLNYSNRYNPYIRRATSNERLNTPESYRGMTNAGYQGDHRNSSSPTRGYSTGSSSVASPSQGVEIMTSQTSSRDKSKVRYGLDSPGGSSGDGRFTIEGRHESSPEMKVMLKHQDEVPTDLSIEKKK